MNSESARDRMLLRRLRWWTALFIVGLVLSGATAIPLETELNWLTPLLGDHPDTIPARWLTRVQAALHETNVRYPFIAYGSDWLAFGHFVIALAFLWAWRDPVGHRWLFDFGLLACALVIPYALFIGALRGIPFWWRLIDCSFGLAGSLPLYLCRRYAAQLARAAGNSTSPPGMPG
ncbi:MAG: hypothetical protein NTV86_02120 [Planctomycetota bacterium]|nr:hypothetical protein [Planctomycetota bacterium]